MAQAEFRSILPCVHRKAIGESISDPKILFRRRKRLSRAEGTRPVVSCKTFREMGLNRTPAIRGGAGSSIREQDEVRATVEPPRDAGFQFGQDR